ncbi:MAG: hypothetical protein ITG07_02090 [Candidimonas sp.]|nr:hypothetical protein [Candidimonas sp.]
MNSTDTWQLLPAFVEAITQSARLRICCSIDRQTLRVAPRGDERLKPYYETLTSTRHALECLATLCRTLNIDPRHHPLFSLLERSAEFLATYENGRCVYADQLTPALIHSVGEKGWRVHYKGWTIQRNALTEMDDHYGLPTLGYPLVIRGPERQIYKLEMPAQPVECAREAYRLITGARFQGDDGLGQDMSHPAEHTY